MAEKTISTRQKQKYDTSTNWTTNNIVLLAGEIGIESDTNKFKVGNGTSTWNELDYAGGSEISLYSTTGQNTDGAMTQKATTDALPQAVSFDLSPELNFDSISMTNEQFNLLLANPENVLIVNVVDDNDDTMTFSWIFHRSQYMKITTDEVTQELLTFNCDEATQAGSVAQMIQNLTFVRLSTSPDIVVMDYRIDFTSFATQSDLTDYVLKTRTINNKSLSNDITLTATDVNALPDTTEIPTTLADLNEDSSHRTVTDAEKTTWNNKSSFSGSYNDLTNKPTIPTALSELSEDATHRLVTDTEKTTWNAKSDFSGSYNDLTDKPTIPTINVNGTPQSTINFDSDPQTQIDNIYNAETHKLGSALLDAIYPVGSIYMSVNSTNPSTLFGGTWEQFAQGRVLLGVGSNGETNYTTAEQTGGSENSVASHTHTQQEHNHTQQVHYHALLSNREKNANANGFGANNKVYGISGVWQDSAPATQYYTVDNAGLAYVKGAAAVNNSTTAVNNSTGEVGGNRMPFITCYIWKRTA